MTNTASTQTDLVLQVQNLKTYFKTTKGTAKSVDGISFDIRKGETFAIVGESGCGKSVTALSIIRLVAQPAGYIAGGTIHLNGRDIAALSEVEMRSVRGNEVSMIFQEPMTSLNPVFTVGFQLEEVFKIHQGLRGAAARKKAVEMLDMVGIPEPVQRHGEYPHQLSGGMKQRVMIAMALACEPALLIADEPTTALDVTIQAQILGLIKDLQTRLGTAVLMITHNMGVVYENADRVGVMYAGHMVEQAPKSELFANPKHPYTIKLLESMPNRAKRGQDLAIIPGRVPLPTQFPNGCRFTDRCHKAMEGCREKQPTLLQVGTEQVFHTVGCHLFDPQFKGKELKQTEKEVPLLELKDFKVHFPIKKGVLKRTVGYVKAVDGVSLSIPAMKTLAVVGESGCGKTTLGKGLLNLLSGAEGSVHFNGRPVDWGNPFMAHKFRRECQIIFQDPYSSLNPRMMVEQIIEEGMITHGIGASKWERIDIIEKLMERVGLDPSMMYRYPHEFSGGQRQRIGIARVLAVNPHFIVCDEATSALDVSVQAQILNLLKELQEEFRLTYMFITHDLSVVEYLADEVAVMYLGRIVEYGKAEEIFDNPKHPYTQALLSAIPKTDESGKKKIKLEGDVPSPINPPSGCHFHPRCPQVKVECSREYPKQARFSATHHSKCWLYPAE